ncbi:patatin-like phospholipase family protein [Alkalilimnicola ehrlichii]|uniref:patatin-like phospholipase family protein n=1 Tax=Alkalilimnicola ehrlichii TaxID=351052 RepID=UPI002162E33F|nr:hypothetical protein [Alkalilimnicola ehrlichii]
MSFYQGHGDIRPWRRSRRLGVPALLAPEHLLASAAIPAVFPAVRLGDQYFGDGSVRQLAPLSPALHLGADRILVIGVSANAEIMQAPVDNTDPGYPSVAHILGHVLNSAFVDSLEGDVERLERINRTLEQMPAGQVFDGADRLRKIDVLKIYPSQPLDVIAAEHAEDLPRTLRMFLRGSGATSGQGSTLMSYLLFEPGFCHELIKLGYHDAMRLERPIMRFLGHDPLAVHGKAGLPASDTC